MTDEVVNPQELARSVAVEASERLDAVGDFVSSTEIGDNVTDFRFVSTLVGYEGWQWSVTLYHDEETQRWTVNESTLVPTDESLLPPAWIPWKDRLKPSDLSVTDSIGTDEHDARLEDGFRPVHHHAGDESKVACDATQSAENSEGAADTMSATSTVDTTEQQQEQQQDQSQQLSDSSQDEYPVNDDLEEAVSTLRLSRRRVMTAEALSQTAKRWYAGQHGPKSLSTKIADGKACSTCGFLIPLAGSLGSMFGVCANMWSPDDGRVVSLDHACGEHSDIEPPQPSQLWVQSAPAYDDYHIDILQQAPREERADVELIEEVIEDSKKHRRKRRKLSNTQEVSDADSSLQSKETNDSQSQTQEQLDQVVAAAHVEDEQLTQPVAEAEHVEQVDASEHVDHVQAFAEVKNEDNTVELSVQDNTIQKDEGTVENVENVDKVTETVASQTKKYAQRATSTAMRLYKRKSRRQHK